jgi:hypothetical protein
LLDSTQAWPQPSTGTSYSTCYVNGDLKATNGGALNLGPRVCHVYNGGLSVTGGSVTGNGVAIVITGSNSCGGSRSVNLHVGTFKVSPIPASHASPNAPCSTFRGISIHDDRALSTINNGITINGNATNYVSGGVHAPNQQITYAGSMQQDGSGSGTFTANDCTNLTGGIGQAQVYVARLVK